MPSEISPKLMSRSCQASAARPSAAVSTPATVSRREEVGATPPSYNRRAMLPAPFQTPAAIVLLLGGLLSCFAGYRVFRIVLGIYGFILGALLASSFPGVDQTWLMVIAALVGGLVGALILIAAYFVGVALIGAGIGALLANAIWASA